MPQSKLRVYFGPQDTPVTEQAPPRRDNVTVSLGEVFPLLSHAVTSQRTWLRDFEQDEISISSDLYEVLLAYQHYQRPGA